MRAKLLVENFIFFGLLRIVSSALPFFILPIITSYLSEPKEFGIYDNFTIAVSIFCSLSMLGSFDAMFREYFKEDSETYRSKVYHTGLLLVLAASLFFALIAIIAKSYLAELFFGSSDYSNLFWVVALTIPIQTTNSMMITPSKLLNNRTHILVHTLLYSITFYALTLGLLELGYSYWSLIIGQLIGFSACILVFSTVNKAFLRNITFSKKIAKNLLAIGLPLVPIFVLYWTNNSIARIFIVNYIGSNELGVFSIGSRYAAVSTLLQVAFAGGWSYFTFSTMKDDDQINIKSKVFGFLSVIICTFFVLVSELIRLVFGFLFESEYHDAVLVFPSLFLAPLLLMLYQIVANQFTIAGKSYMSLIALGIGAILNISYSYYVANFIGDIQSIALSVPLGYLLSLIVIIFLGVKYQTFSIDKQAIWTLVILVFLLLLQHFHAGMINTSLSVLFLGLVFLINKEKLVEGGKIIIGLIKPLISR